MKNSLIEDELAKKLEKCRHNLERMMFTADRDEYESLKKKRFECRMYEREMEMKCLSDGAELFIWRIECEIRSRKIYGSIFGKKLWYLNEA